MGLKISTNIASEMVQRNLRDASREEAESLQKLSSGSRLTSAADDAAGLAIATKHKAQAKSLRQATRNANDGISFVQAAEGGLNEVSNILTRLRELSIQSASDTIGESERKFLDLEYQQLTTEIDRISGSTKFNGIDLLGGGDSRVVDFHVGSDESQENAIQFDLGLINSATSEIGINGTGVSEKSDALDSIDEIDSAINNVSGQRASLGALQGRLQTTVTNLEGQTINIEQARSMVQDVDIASEAATLTSSQIVKSAGISTLVQANAITSKSLKLL